MQVFSYHIVNHAYNFLNPNNRNAHTQSLESHWLKIRRDMRRQIGKLSTSKLVIYLIEYTWRNLYKSNEDFLLFFECGDKFL